VKRNTNTTELGLVAVADRVLESMYRPGRPAPSITELRASYPFQVRGGIPGQVWTNRVRAWTRAHAAGERRPPSNAKRIADPAAWDGATGNLFEPVEAL
jgi:hypothetical protein